MSETARVAPPVGSGSGALLRLLRDGVPRTRSELATITGVARSTIAIRVDQLMSAGLLAPVGDAASTGGRPSARFTFNVGARVVLAADLGASHGRVALTDLAGQVLAEQRTDFSIAEGPEACLGWVAEAGRELLASAHRQSRELVGIGLGLPGPVEHLSGRPINPPIMPGWDGFDVAGWLRERFEVPVLVDNDVNIMALGEHFSEWRTSEHLLFIKVATGIGAGLVSEGRLHRGAQGAAGDLGHVRVPDGADAQCRCGNTGCLEAVASGSALAGRLRDKGIAAADSRAVVALARGGSIEALSLVRQAGRDLGAVLATCVSILNPSIIVIGGSLSDAGEHLLAGVREVVYSRSLPLATQHLRIVKSRTGDRAGSIGAAVMVIEHTLDPEILDASLLTAAAGG
ncbi:MAG: ROK family transcriptional regulator [Mycobacteriales bacterium]